MIRKKLVATFLTATLCTSLLAGCGGQQDSTDDAAPSETGETRDDLVIALATEPTQLDPHYLSDTNSSLVVLNTHDPLFRRLPSGEIEPALAEDYELSEDGTSITLYIRQGVKFQDGTELTAEDVAFTINGIVNGEAAEADLSMVDEARAVDAITCEIAMKRPNNALLYTLAVVGIVPAHAYGPDYGEHPIGSGRYMLEQWDRGQQVILRANPDYYGEKPLMDRVVVLFMEEDASLAAAQSGTADVAYTSAALAGAVPAGYTLLNCASVDSRGISLPCNPAGTDVTVEGDMVYAGGNDVTSDIAVRRALNYGIDRVRMIEHVLAGFGRAAYSVGDGMPWSSDAMRVETDVAAAERLLDAARANAPGPYFPARPYGRADNQCLP